MPTERTRPPSVERVLTASRPLVPGATEPSALTSVARDVIAEERGRLAAGEPARMVDTLAEDVAGRLAAFADPLAQRPHSCHQRDRGHPAHEPRPGSLAAGGHRSGDSSGCGYSLLEFDRDEGHRGPRFRAAETHLIALTGAEDALVTVNNAAALALAVGLAGRRGVAVSRGELVEIGGGVRIPEIVRRTGARLIEVGTTNRTRASDFEAPLAEGRATVVLRVHPSNFAQTGFVEAPDPIEVARLAHAHGAIVVDDVGSGALLDTAAFGLAHEPTPAERWRPEPTS